MNPEILLYNIDCLELINVLIKANIKIDLLLTDPPYNISRNNNFKSMGRHGIDFGEWDKNFNQMDWLLKLNKIINKNGSIIIFNSFDNLAFTRNVLEKNGFIYKDFCIMEKSDAMPRNRDRRYINSCEYFIFMVNKDAKWVFNRQSDKYDKNIIKCSVVKGKEKLGHPTQKPISVIEELILRHSNKGNLVADFFFGSGTVPFVCKKQNRNFIGSEINIEYVEMTNNRIYS